MQVLVTGGTGFVGSHICKRLLAEGCNLKLLVRDTVKAGAMVAHWPNSHSELIAGDITDRGSVERAVAGCQAVVHAAAATPMQGLSERDLFAVNVDGTGNVCHAAHQAGVESIVCVSSVTAIFDTDPAKVTVEAKPKPSRLPYGRSKQSAELLLRDLQSRGAPVSIVYPGGVIGPDDPALSDTCRALQYRLTQGFRIFGDGGIQHLDVRDLADFVCVLTGRGTRERFLLPGVFLRWSELADLLDDISGAAVKRIPARGWQLRLIGRLMDLMRHFRSIESPISAETMRYATQWPRIANTRSLEEFGLSLREPRQTFTDTLIWMVKRGHLDPGLAPRLIETASHDSGSLPEAPERAE
ncbi:MAG: SDR family NAD(P)-dependent oxidoreductase [Pseudomonadota bacterium]